MRAKCIIGINSFAHCIGSGCIVCKHLTQSQLMLEDAVDTLRDGIVIRTSGLCHADADVMLLQHGYVGLTAVLDAPVRVMDELSCFSAIRQKRNGFVERYDTTLRLQTLAQVIAYNLSGVSIRNQRQVHKTGFCLEVSNIADLELFRCCQPDALDKI